MTYINEVIPEEEVKANGLDALKKQFYPWEWRDGRPSVFTHTWTIDKSSGNFLYFVFHWSVSAAEFDRPLPIAKYTCILRWCGKNVPVILEGGAGPSRLAAESPYRVVWSLAEIDRREVQDVPIEILLGELKEALKAYGAMGYFYQIPNTVVTFSF